MDETENNSECIVELCVERAQTDTDNGDKYKSTSSNEVVVRATSHF